jgi:hypothetical protein
VDSVEAWCRVIAEEVVLVGDVKFSETKYDLTRTKAALFVSQLFTTEVLEGMQEFLALLEPIESFTVKVGAFANDAADPPAMTACPAINELLIVYAKRPVLPGLRHVRDALGAAMRKRFTCYVRPTAGDVHVLLRAAFMHPAIGSVDWLTEADASAVVDAVVADAVEMRLVDLTFSFSRDSFRNTVAQRRDYGARLLARREHERRVQHDARAGAHVHERGAHQHALRADVLARVLPRRLPAPAAPSRAPRSHGGRRHVDQVPRASLRCRRRGRCCRRLVHRLDRRPPFPALLR